MRFHGGNSAKEPLGLDCRKFNALTFFSEAAAGRGVPRESGCTAVTTNAVAGLVMVELAGLLGKWIEKV